jgi:hypothetical protein
MLKMEEEIIEAVRPHLVAENKRCHHGFRPKLVKLDGW